MNHCAGAAFCEIRTFCAVRLGLVFQGWCFWGVGRGCDIVGLAFHAVASTFVTSLSSNGDFDGWERVQNVSKSFQTCGVVQNLVIFCGTLSTLCGLFRCGGAVFMAGAGNREITTCGGGHISWLAQYFVCVGGVDVQIFVAGAGHGEVASCGGGECRCDIGIGV